jgi:hypothetical protein
LFTHVLCAVGLIDSALDVGPKTPPCPITMSPYIAVGAMAVRAIFARSVTSRFTISVSRVRPKASAQSRHAIAVHVVSSCALNVTRHNTAKNISARNSGATCASVALALKSRQALPCCFAPRVMKEKAGYSAQSVMLSTTDTYVDKDTRDN